MMIYVQVKILLSAIIISLCILMWALILYLYNRLHKGYSPKQHYLIFRFFLWFVTLFAIIIVYFVLQKWASVTIIPFVSPDFEFIASMHRSYGNIFVLFSPEQLNYIFMIWFGTALLFLIFDVNNYFINKNQLMKASRIDPKLDALLNEVKEELHIKDKILAYYCERIATPAIIGFLRPYILIPDIFETNEEIMAIKHELTHHKKKDLWIKWYLIVLKRLFWFNPAIYYIAGGYDFLRESSCDEIVISNSTELEKIAYIEAIIKAAEYANSSSRKVVSVSLVDQKKDHLIRRIDVMLKNKNNKSTKFVLSFVCVLGMLFTTANVYALSEGIYYIANNYELGTFDKRELINHEIPMDFVGMVEVAFSDYEMCDMQYIVKGSNPFSFTLEKEERKVISSGTYKKDEVVTIAFSCSPTSGAFKLTFGDATYTSRNGSIVATITIKTTGTYYLTLENLSAENSISITGFISY